MEGKALSHAHKESGPLRGSRRGGGAHPESGGSTHGDRRPLPEPALEMVVGGKRTSVCLGFITCDSRTSDFTLRYAASLEFLHLAKRPVGSPYGIGLYFVDQTDLKPGKATRKLLESRKGEVDPRGRLNPGKILSVYAADPRLRVLRAVMAVGTLSLPLAVSLCRLVPGVRLLWRMLPEHVEKAAFTCAQCGYFKEDCTFSPVAGGRAPRPGGKMQFLRGYARGEISLRPGDGQPFSPLYRLQEVRPGLPGRPSHRVRLGGDARGIRSRGKVPCFPVLRDDGSLLGAGEQHLSGLRLHGRSAWFPEAGRGPRHRLRGRHHHLSLL